MTNYPFCRSFALVGVLILSIYSTSMGQDLQDTVRVLDTLTVEAYAADRSPTEVAASVGVVQRSDLARFSTSSLLPAFNVLPGIRMEERSPGSYRFSIRGSLLRSPFGVRNVKFYWNGLPFTDGGGNTYLNLIDLYAVNRAEVIKGPAGSLYGAGTGGAVLLRAPGIPESGLGLTAQYGSFGSIRYGGSLEAHSDNTNSRIQFIRQQSDGYREQSAFKRNAFNVDMSFRIDTATIVTVTFLNTDLYYQTPGGLTEQQYFADPRQARPPSPISPGAVEQHAEVYNRTFLSGVTLDRQWNRQWSTTLGLVGSNTNFRNFAIRNYESRKEDNIGARLSSSYERLGPDGRFKLTFGGEYQRFTSTVEVSNNDKGFPGTTISFDDITSDQVMGFAQLETTLKHEISLTAGASVNYLQYADNRLALVPPETSKRKFNPVLLPRLAVLKKFSASVILHLSASRGYSPPSVAEVVPSTGIYNPTLLPETGWSYEAGVRGKIGHAISYDLAIYDFRLTNAIVLKRDSSGADYFVNAGDVIQQGAELAMNWTKHYDTWITMLRFTTSLTYNHYRFGNYVNDGKDYSGNHVTGVPPFVAVIGMDAAIRSGWYLQVTANFTERLPLNDANTDFSSDYFLVGARGGFRTSRKVPFDLYVGVDNALNQRYSLGHDLNAAGGRYYNAAPTANYYFGLTSRVPFKKRS